jgi:two-component system NtrC family sensor kinase
MKLQTKFILAITVIFIVLAVGIAVLNINYVNSTTIREAENRVRIYLRAGWEIYNSKTARILSALQVLSRDHVIVSFLKDPADEELRAAATRYLETVRRDQQMDILNVTAPDGTVLLRTRAPYNTGDNLARDPLIKHVLADQAASSGTIILELDRLDVEGDGLVERCLAVGGEPRGMMAGAAVPVVENGKLLGVIEMGGLLNGAAEKVDRIRDAVFENEYYQGKPVGTATIFMGDMRISTNVLDKQGRRAVGTRVSKEVADRVLGEGLSWTGRAFVVDTWYLSQYDPIRDPDGQIIGMLYVGELEKKYLDLRTRAVISNLTVILLGLVLAYLLWFFLIRGIVKPIRQLSEASHRISEGDLSQRVPVGRADEIGDLAASFNHMAEQLQKQRQEIEARNQELEQLSRELKATNENYIDMLGFVTHELKNPLASAVMSLYTVKDGYLGEITPAQKKSLEAVAKSLDHFQAMIKDYLDLSRLEKGEFVVRKRPVALNRDVVQPIATALEREMQERRMTFDNHIPDDLTVSADPSMLRIVYDNLLANALKYGREGGTISLDAAESADRITLSITNDSEGIPPEKMPLLFKKFSRLDGPEYAGKKGTGLGLYICKEIIAKHGGEIWVDSKAGQWVRFSFTLPRSLPEETKHA